MIYLFIAAFVTSLISAILGMAGGLILMGIYSLLLPVAAAFVMHGVTQFAANGYRFWLLRQHVLMKPLMWYLLGAFLSVGIFLAISFVPDRKMIFLGMGTLAVISPVLGKFWVADYSKGGWAIAAAFMTNSAQLICGVGGPLLDLFFVRTRLTKKQIIANKAITQTFAHAIKVGYFVLISAKSDGTGWPTEITLPLVVGSIACSFLGTATGAEQISEQRFKTLVRVTVFLIGIIYLLKGMTTSAGAGS